MKSVNDDAQSPKGILEIAINTAPNGAAVQTRSDDLQAQLCYSNRVIKVQTHGEVTCFTCWVTHVICN